MLHKFSNYLFVFVYYFPYYSNYLLFINNELICVILKQIIGFQDVYICERLLLVNENRPCLAGCKFIDVLQKLL